jgi:two-component system NtrC family response regulator
MMLAHKTMSEEINALGRGHVSFSPAAIAALTDYHWPGNVRELQNRIRRALGTNPGRIIDPVDLGLEEKQSGMHEKEKLLTLKQAREEAETQAIRNALALTGNNISRAAKLLEISRPTLHDLLKKHGISTDK